MRTGWMRGRWTTGLVGCAAAALAISLTASAAWADLGPPRPRPVPPKSTTKTAAFEVMVATSGGSDTPTLIIPREAVKGLADGAALPGMDDDRLADGGPPGFFDLPPGFVDPTTGAAESARSSNPAQPSELPAASSRLHSIIAGLSVALAMALGGVWMARGRSRTTTRGLMLLVAASLSLGVSVTAWANGRPPLPPVKPKTDAPSTRLETAFTGKVQVKFVSGDGPVQLVLPRADLQKLIDRESKDSASSN